MRTLRDIELELERATARRSELWHRLGHGRDGALALEVARLNSRIEELWDARRSARARERSGPSEAIRRRAQREARIERDLRRRYEDPVRRAA